MIRNILLPLGCLLMLAACATETPEPEVAATETPEPEVAATETPEPEVAATETTEPVSGPSFLALHLYNPASDDAHQQLLSDLDELSEVVASSGHPETRYRVWKVTGEQTGDYGYAFGSVWADRATYDAVHEHDDYKAVMARVEQAGLEPFAEEVYNQYVELNPPATERAPRPEGGSTSLALHLFNLPSAEAEEQLLSMLDEFNKAISQAGHPETRYGVWKVTGEQTGDYAYIFASVWADQATYDAVHEHADYKAVLERHDETLESLLSEEVYNRYEPMMLQ